MADENKRVRRDKVVVLSAKIENTQHKIAILESRLEDAKKQLAKFQADLELATNETLRKEKEAEQKKIAKFIKDNSISLEQLEELLK